MMVGRLCNSKRNNFFAAVFFLYEMDEIDGLVVEMILYLSNSKLIEILTFMKLNSDYRTSQYVF